MAPQPHERSNEIPSRANVGAAPIQSLRASQSRLNLIGVKPILDKMTRDVWDRYGTDVGTAQSVSQTRILGLSAPYGCR
jgi:hypothetical protein